MPGGNTNLSENEPRLSEAEIHKRRNAANNANTVRQAADMASKSVNPYAKAAGTAVKAADKLSDGKASEKLGKYLNYINKLSLQKRAMQAASNKMNDSDTSSRISNSLNKKKGSPFGFMGANMKSNATAQGKDNSFLDKREVEDQTSDGGEAGLKAAAKVIKIGIAVAPFAGIIMVFMCLFVAASQIYLNVIGIGQADEVSSGEADTQIRENGSDNLDNEIKDENSADNETSFNYRKDIFVDNEGDSHEFSINKFNKNNFVANTRSREYNEADLKELEDYYSDINSYKGHNMDTVYKFFFKLLYIQRHYEKNYGIGNNIGEQKLDTALIMSVLSLQSENKSDVFISNIEDYKVTPKEDNSYFNYYYDWSDYKSTKNYSAHDIEVLAQGMIKKTADTGCSDTVDGACYELASESEYREFLKGFLEKKYFLNSNNSSSSGGGSGSGDSNAGDSELDSGSSSSDDSTNVKPAVGNFRQWTQCGQSWSNKTVPNSTATMCKIGCLITSVTMQIARSGTITLETPIDPGVALKYYKFAKGGNLYWYSPSNLAQNFKYYTAINLAGMSKESIAKKLSSYDSSKYYMVLAVSKKDRKSVHHYVALDYVDLSTNKIYIMDPSSTEQTDLYEYYKVYKTHIYEKKD